MRRITMVGAAAAIALGGLLGGAGTATAEPDVTPEQCHDGGGFPVVFAENPLTGELHGVCAGGEYDGHHLRR